MLGLGDTASDLGKAETTGIERKVGAGARLAPVVRQSSVNKASRGKLPSMDQESLTGTPASVTKKGTNAMRASSTSKFSNSMSSMSMATKSLKGDVRGGTLNATKKQKDNDSDLELDDFHDLIEKMELDDALNNVKKQIKKTEESHKQNFLTTFFERTES